MMGNRQFFVRDMFMLLGACIIWGVMGMSEVSMAADEGANIPPVPAESSTLVPPSVPVSSQSPVVAQDKVIKSLATLPQSATAAGVPVDVVKPEVATANPSDNKVKDAVKQVLVDGIMKASQTTGIDSGLLAKGGQALVNMMPAKDAGGAGGAPIEEFQPSYGTWKYSIMFGRSDIEKLKKVVEMGERALRKGEDVPKAVSPEDDEIAKLLSEAEAKNPNEPVQIVYPSFHLHSIAYSSAKQWSVWVNSVMLSNETPESEEGLKVVGLNNEKVDFLWTPPKEFVDALKKLEMQKRLAKQKSVPAYDAPSRIALDTKSGSYDQKAQEMRFSLRPNQVFFTETYHVFEGLPKTLNFVDAGAKGKEVEEGENMETAPSSEVNTTSQNTQAVAATPKVDAPNVDSGIEDVLNTKQSPKAKMEKVLNGKGVASAIEGIAEKAGVVTQESAPIGAAALARAREAAAKKASAP